MLGAVVAGALPVLVAPELLRLTVVLVPEDVPVDVFVLVFERFTVVVEFPVDVAPPFVTVVFRFEYPLSVRTVLDVPFCFTLPVVVPEDPRTALVDLVRVYVVPFAVVTLVRVDFLTTTPPFSVIPVATAPPRYGLAFAEAYVAFTTDGVVLADAYRYAFAVPLWRDAF